MDMFCKNCGNEIKDGVKFCDKCGTPQDESAEILTNTPDAQGSKLSVIMKNKKILFVLIAVVILLIIIIIVGIASRNTSDKSLSENVEEKIETPIEESEAAAGTSKYQNTNSYGIPCNGNNDLAIEAANVFADKYGASGHDWTLTNVDASVSGMSGTYRYSYTWVGNSYTATTNFTITDYGSYRNYVWEGDYVDLFYGG